MKIIIVRHADPDYEHDTVTEKGKREVELLTERLIKLDVSEFYCSPYGRAKATAAPTLAALGRTAQTFDWLKEFDGYVKDPVTSKMRIPWDLMPSYWSKDDSMLEVDKWLETPIMKSGNTKERFEAVCGGLDSILSEHGYERNGRIYTVKKESRETLVFFCHFGVECVMLSHLLNISPVALWHGFVALPSSVTVLATEEREQGIAAFRCMQFGDLSHLYAGGEPASFMARFCETYSNKDERH